MPYYDIWFIRWNGFRCFWWNMSSCNKFKSIPKYAMSTGANMGMLSCCFFGVQEILAYARNKRDVWNSVGAGATSGFISFAAYGGPRFGVFGTIIMSTVGFGGHYVGEKIIFAKDEFVKARRKHLKRSEIKK